MAKGAEALALMLVKHPSKRWYNYFMRYILLLIFIIFFQLQLVSASSYSDVSLTLQPQYPQPGEIVQASLSTYAYNLQNIEIVWTLDDALLQKGVGLTAISLSAPNLGKQATLKATIGTLAKAESVVAPVSIDILWEADTFSPPRYLGRALPVDGSYVRIAAIAHLGVNISSDDLIFSWYKNGRLLANASGRGESSIYIDSPRLYADYTISVQVLSLNESMLGQNSVKITSTKPQLVLYPESPLLGTLFYNAITKNYEKSQDIESSIVAVPYNFSITSPLSLIYKWSIIGSKSIQNKNPNNISILKMLPSTEISVTASHPGAFSQSASKYYSPPSESMLDDIYSTESDYQSPFGSNNN